MQKMFCISFIALYLFKKKRSINILICLALLGFITACTPPAYRTGSNADLLSESNSPLGSNRKRIVDTALSQIGTPYRAGGTTPSGFDCSGFTGYVYKKNKIALARTAANQYRQGHRVKRIKAGDLIFFDINGGVVSHVGIYIGKGRFVHAPSSGKTVSVESLDNPYWKPRLVGAATFFKD